MMMTEENFHLMKKYGLDSIPDSFFGANPNNRHLLLYRHDLSNLLHSALLKWEVQEKEKRIEEINSLVELQLKKSKNIFGFVTKKRLTNVLNEIQKILHGEVSKKEQA